MHQSRSNAGNSQQSSNNWHADKPFLKVPKVTGSRIIDGVKYYTGIGDKLYVASLFDSMFKTVKGKVKPLYYKGADEMRIFD